MMADKKNDQETRYIIDRFRKRPKKEEKDGQPSAPVRQSHKRPEDEDMTDIGLGCWFFLILPFIGTLLALIIIIALLQV